MIGCKLFSYLHCHPSPDHSPLQSLRRGNHSVKIAPETNESPQRLIGLGSWTPSVQVQDNRDPEELFVCPSSWGYANTRLAESDASDSEKSIDANERGKEELGLKDTANEEVNDRDQEIEDTEKEESNSDSDDIGNNRAR